MLRLAQLLRGLDARSPNGRNSLHYLDGSDDALGQTRCWHPRCSISIRPSNRPGHWRWPAWWRQSSRSPPRPPWSAQLNFFASVVQNGGYGWDDSALRWNFEPLQALAAGTGAALVDRLDLLLFDLQMGATTRQRLLALLMALPGTEPWGAQGARQGGADPGADVAGPCDPEVRTTLSRPR